MAKVRRPLGYTACKTNAYLLGARCIISVLVVPDPDEPREAQRDAALFNLSSQCEVSHGRANTVIIMEWKYARGLGLPCIWD